MSIVTLTVRHAPGMRVDARGLLPAALAELGAAEIERMVLPAGNERCRVGDLFDVSRTDDEPATLVIEGEVPWLDRVGADMTTGRLVVQGSVDG
jgi:formylmethanofuran dehydrogenase subunit C